MFKYRIYYANPSSLTSLLDCIIDDKVMTPIDETNTMHKFYLMNLFLFKFLIKFRNYTNTEINFMLDFKKIYNYNYLINWLTLDFPFSTNPYLVINNYNSNINIEIIFDIFKKQNFNFSHRTSLRETYNFNSFFDWSSGTYLDLFNLTSYMGSVRGGMGLPDIFFNNPSYVAASFIKFKRDESKNFAKDIQYRDNSFIVSDLLISSDYAMHNLSLLNFFQESLGFVFSFNTNFYEKKNFFSFLKFYFKSTFLDDVYKFKSLAVIEIDSKILKSFSARFFKI